MPRKPKVTKTAKGTPIPTAMHRVEFAERTLRKNTYPTTRDLIMQQFRVSKATAERDIQEAKQLIAADAERDRPLVRAYETRRLERIADKAEADAQFHAAVAASREIGKLNGAYAAKKIQIETNVSVSIQMRAIVAVLDEAGLAALEVLTEQIERAKADGRLLALPSSVVESASSESDLDNN